MSSAKAEIKMLFEHPADDGTYADSNRCGEGDGDRYGNGYRGTHDDNRCGEGFGDSFGSGEGCGLWSRSNGNGWGGNSADTSNSGRRGWGQGDGDGDVDLRGTGDSDLNSGFPDEAVSVLSRFWTPETILHAYAYMNAASQEEKDAILGLLELSK